MKILMIAAEATPFAKAGGLGDVVGTLPKELVKQGHEVAVAIPRYGFVEPEKWKLKLAATDIEVELPENKKHIGAFLHTNLDGVNFYFLDHYEIFGRRETIYGGASAEHYYFFNTAIFELCKKINFQPDILHAHDWHAGLVPYLLKTKYGKDAFFQKTSAIFTIHNLAYQGEKAMAAPKNKIDDGKSALPEKIEDFKYLNFVRRGIVWAEMVNTVSENYAEEVQTPEFGYGLEHLLKAQAEKEKFIGITNGIDENYFNPANDKNLRSHYTYYDFGGKGRNKGALRKYFKLPFAKRTPILGIASRITEQKGFDLLIEAFDWLMKLDIQLVIVGGGSAKYTDFLKKMAKEHPDKMAIHLGFSEKIASLVYAGSDIFLMPSRFEPCGLGQLISLRYGSIPIVRATGGLVDTISNYDPTFKTGDGFVFDDYKAIDFYTAIVRAVTCYKHKSGWRDLVKRGMQETFSWEIPAKRYLRMYYRARKLKLNNNA